MANRTSPRPSLFDAVQPPAEAWRELTKFCIPSDVPPSMYQRFGDVAVSLQGDELIIVQMLDGANQCLMNPLLARNAGMYLIALSDLLYQRFKAKQPKPRTRRRVLVDEEAK